MSDHSFEDVYFDSILTQALKQIEEEKIEKEEAEFREYENMPDFKPSLRYKWRMKKLIRDYDKKNSSRKPFPIARVAFAASFALIIVFSTGVFASADIFKLFQWLGFYTEEYVDISISIDYTQRIVEETASWQHGTVYVPGLIPDGYELDTITVNSKVITIDYKSLSGNYFRFSMKKLGDDNLATIDNDSSEVKKLKIKGYDAVYIIKDSVSTLRYNTNEYFLSFTSDVLRETELKKIAENIESLDKLVVK